MKHHKLLSFFLAAAITAGSLMPASSFALTTGDVDRDGTIAGADLTLLQNYILGNAELESAQAEIADLNGDGVVDSWDVSALRKLILSNSRNIKYKAVTDRIQTGYTDALKKLDIKDGGTVVGSTEELKALLAPYFSESLVNSYAAKYNASFFKESVLMVKPVYFDPAAYKTVTKAPCGCTSAYAGIYTPSAEVTEFMNIRKEHDFNSEALGQILPGEKFTITYGNGSYGHVNYNGISGYVNMAYVTKVSDIAPQYTAYPDIKIDSISYEGGSITVNASQFNASAPVGFAPAVIAQAVVSRKDYYASETNWKVTVPEPPAPKYNFPLAKERLDQIGWDLKAAFNYASSVPYYGRQQDPTFPQDDQTSMEWYAEYGFNNGKGNCYVMAAMFCEMAKLLGYDAHQISGRVPLKAGGYGPHSWVEINFDGTTYVCDPDFTEETKRNGYMITYGQSGTWKYVKDSVMS